MRGSLRLSLLSAGILAAVGCANDSTLSHVSDTYGHGSGSISGRVCDPSRYVWLEGASVYTHIIDTAGELRDTRETLTDADGNWVLDDLAAGTYTVYEQYGSTTIDMFDVTVSNAVETEVPPPDCTGSADVQVAVITGDFDDFQTVLETVGVGSYHDVDGQTGDEMLQFLENPTEMALYDAIFFAGGHLEDGIFYSLDHSEDATVATVQTNLKDYVKGGGVVFASDWSYDVIEQTWPDMIDFMTNDTPDASQVGEPGLLSCDVSNSDLADTLGQDTVKMNLDLDAWPVVDAVGDGPKVFLRADAPWRTGMTTDTENDSPLLVEIESGKGKIVFTPWRFSANLDGARLKVVKWLMDREL